MMITLQREEEGRFQGQRALPLCVLYLLHLHQKKVKRKLILHLQVNPDRVLQMNQGVWFHMEILVPETREKLDLKSKDVNSGMVSLHRQMGI